MPQVDLDGLQSDFSIEKLEDVQIPIVNRLHTKLRTAIESFPEQFRMCAWHAMRDEYGELSEDNWDETKREIIARGTMPDPKTCGTTHCRAGWVITLGEIAGLKLEDLVGPATAGKLIEAASAPWMNEVPLYHDEDEESVELVIGQLAKEENRRAHM